jgi:glycosyltransferase involved in cell wall biosynthesis
MEAMACGIPVITTGYIPASLERNNSWIVPINDPQAISNAVREIIKNTDVRNERILNANKDIQDFSWEAVSEKMLNIFKDISDH